MKTKLVAALVLCAVCLSAQTESEAKKSFFQRMFPFGSDEQAPAFPSPAYFRQHFSSPQTRVELLPPAKLEDYVQDGKLVLSLKAYIDLVLANNTDVAIQRLSVETSKNSLLSAYSQFDPRLTLNMNHSRNAQPSSDLLAGADIQKTLSQSAGLTYSQTLQTGQQYSVAFNPSRSTSNSAFATWNPSWNAGLNISVTQQLLRGRSPFIQKLQITTARANLRRSELDQRNQFMQLIQTAELAYWSLVGARENLRVQAQSLELQKVSLDRSNRELELGAMAPLDIYRPQADYASAEIRFSQAQFNLKSLEDALRRQIGADLDPRFRDIPIEVTESIQPPPDTGAFDRESLVQKAIAARPDLQSSRILLETDDLSIRQAVDQLRPQLSLTGTYQTTGRGGNFYQRSLTGGPAILVAPGGFWDAWSRLWGFDTTNHSVRLQLTLPLRDRQGAASLANALIRKKQDALSLRRSEQQVRLDVQNAITNLESSRKSVELALVQLDLAQKQYEAEQKKYDLGTSIMFYVLDAQQRLTSAQNQLTTEYINYHRNRLALLRATGELLEERGIVVQ